MASTVLVGLQWGDEGKGKIIDVLTETADVVARFQGGNNAGHTVEIGSEKFVLHLIPSGILRPEADCVLGNGMVVDVLGLLEEIRGLEARGIKVAGRLWVSDRCHLVFPYHSCLDGLSEAQLGKAKIGTTKRGIGPAYADKINRCGARGSDLVQPARLEARFRRQAAVANELLKRAGQPAFDADAEWPRIRAAAAALAPMVTDTTLRLHAALDAGRRVLFEGAQGTWLDVDFGTYPYVTSSNTTSGGACTGTGVPPCAIDSVFGVVKAYTTRVGEGPFPTELTESTGEGLRNRGREFGATTGRPRRCGWFDAVATRYAVRLNGASKLAFTKLDVLDGMATLKICVGYEIAGRRYDAMPADVEDVALVTPVYETHPGWQESTTDARRWDDLPAAAQSYLRRLETLVGAKAAIISVGPNRAQTFSV
ncbi:MAG: adenylosuccinate synthase [Lentisphaeria bacterium]